MIILHFHLQPQFKNELFHILHIISLLTGDMNSINQTSLPMCGFIAQLVEQRTGNAEVTGSNPVEALIFFLSNCLNWKIYCDDHSSLSSATTVQKWIISYTSHHYQLCSDVMKRQNYVMFQSATHSASMLDPPSWFVIFFFLHHSFCTEKK